MTDNDKMDAYKQGIWDAVMIINENEDTEYLWTDIYKALELKRIIERVGEM